MRRFAVLLAICGAALAQQTMTVNQVSQFLHSATHELKGRQSDQEIATFLSKVKLSERLDDAMVEQLQAEGIGPKTLAALRALHDRSAALPAAPAAITARPIMPPPPSSAEQAAILDSVRQYALEYSQKLPDFICHEAMTTYVASPRAGDNWSLASKIDSRLTYFKQKEDYKPFLQDGKLTTQDYQKLKTSKSVGDFGTMLRGIFEPASQTRFEWRGWSTFDGRRAMDFNYRVEQERSNYTITADGSRSATPGYSGYFVVDAATHAIVKLTIEAGPLPAGFPVQSAQATLYYRDQDIAGKTFLLPANYEAFLAGPEGRDRIVKEFSGYRKYTADSEITFGDDAPVIKKQ